jgi:uncharacterized membrane-anchored protein
MTAKQTKLFWTLVLAQAGFLLGWAGYHEYVRQHAQVIVLKGRPVDPQDLLRGDFMILNYDISSVTMPGTPADQTPSPDIWALLEKKDRYHVIVQASAEKLEPKAGQLLVRGTRGYDWRTGAAGTTRVDYGIEKYFVPEGKGTPRFQLMEVEVSVSPAHRLYIKQVLLDGKAFP